MFKCPIINADAINQRCGYGEGKTWELAVANALEVAKKQDPNAHVEGNSITVQLGHSFQETKGNNMTPANFVIVRNADIDIDMSDCNYQVALLINNQEYFYVADNMTKSDAQDLANSLNIQNNLTGN